VVFPEDHPRTSGARSAKAWYAEVLNWLDRWLARAS
jgi:hypothetical protein